MKRLQTAVLLIALGSTAFAGPIKISKWSQGCPWANEAEVENSLFQKNFMDHKNSPAVYTPEKTKEHDDRINFGRTLYRSILEQHKSWDPSEPKSGFIDFETRDYNFFQPGNKALSEKDRTTYENWNRVATIFTRAAKYGSNPSKPYIFDLEGFEATKNLLDTDAELIRNLVYDVLGKEDRDYSEKGFIVRTKEDERKYRLERDAFADFIMKARMAKQKPVLKEEIHDIPHEPLVKKYRKILKPGPIDPNQPYTLFFYNPQTEGVVKTKDSSSKPFNSYYFENPEGKEESFLTVEKDSITYEEILKSAQRAFGKNKSINSLELRIGPKTNEFRKNEQAHEDFQKASKLLVLSGNEAEALVVESQGALLEKKDEENNKRLKDFLDEDGSQEEEDKARQKLPKGEQIEQIDSNSVESTEGKNRNGDNLSLRDLYEAREAALFASFCYAPKKDMSKGVEGQSVDTKQSMLLGGQKTYRSVCDIHVWDEVAKQIKPKRFNVRYFYSDAEHSGAIYHRLSEDGTLDVRIAWHGTDSLRNVGTDIRFRNVIDPYGIVSHLGFHNGVKSSWNNEKPQDGENLYYQLRLMAGAYGYTNLMDMLSGKTSRLLDVKKVKISFLGHSLGGALAIRYGTEIANLLNKADPKTVETQYSIRTFGAPRTIGVASLPQVKKLFDQYKFDVRCFIQEGDPVSGIVASSLVTNAGHLIDSKITLKNDQKYGLHVMASYRGLLDDLLEKKISSPEEKTRFNQILQTSLFKRAVNLFKAAVGGVSSGVEWTLKKFNAAGHYIVRSTDSHGIIKLDQLTNHITDTGINLTQLGKERQAIENSMNVQNDKHRESTGDQSAAL